MFQLFASLFSKARQPLASFMRWIIASATAFQCFQLLSLTSFSSFAVYLFTPYKLRAFLSMVKRLQIYKFIYFT